MILLHTNVISEARKSRSGTADCYVVGWFGQVAASSLFVSVVSLLELGWGVLCVERRDVTQGQLLRRWLDEQVVATIVGRMLSVDAAVARQAARLHVLDPRLLFWLLCCCPQAESGRQ